MNEAAQSGFEHEFETRTPEDLAREAQSGRELAARSFEELVARFEGPLYQFLLLRVGSCEVAEEIAQETFLRAWHKLPLYDPSRRFSTWLFTLGKHLAVSHVRKRSSSEETQAPVHWDSPDATTDPADAAQEREEGIRLWRIASQVLKVEQRSALWLRYAEDLSIDEISRILGKRAVSVRVLLHRAREVLAKHLPPLGFDPMQPIAAGGPDENRGNRCAPEPYLVQNTGGRK